MPQKCKEISLDLALLSNVKTKGEISSNFVAFSEYMNFNIFMTLWFHKIFQFSRNCCSNNMSKVKTDHKEGFNNPENLITYHQLLFWVTMITIKILTNRA